MLVCERPISVIMMTSLTPYCAVNANQIIKKEITLIFWALFMCVSPDYNWSVTWMVMQKL